MDSWQKLGLRMLLAAVVIAVMLEVCGLLRPALPSPQPPAVTGAHETAAGESVYNAYTTDAPSSGINWGYAAPLLITAIIGALLMIPRKSGASSGPTS